MAVGWDRRVKKFTLLDEKLSQFSVVFAVLIIMKLLPFNLNLGFVWSIPLCSACAIWSLYVYWVKDGKKGGAGWERRIQKFTFLDLVIAHLAFVFALFIAVRVVPQILDAGIEWLVPLFIAFAVKPFYVFWFKGENERPAG